MQMSLELFTAFLPSVTKLRRLCFYTCLSFCSQGWGVCLSACWDTTTTPWDQTPPWTRHPQQQTPPQAVTILLGAGTPQEQASPRSRQPHLLRQTAGYCCGRYASYWNASLFLCVTVTMVMLNSDVDADVTDSKQMKMLKFEVCCSLPW